MLSLNKSMSLLIFLFFCTAGITADFYPQNGSELRADLITASFSIEPNTIYLAPNSYLVTEGTTGTFTYLGRSNLTIKGAGKQTSILSGANIERVIYLDCPAHTCEITLEDLTVTSGFLFDDKGAGIFSNENINLKNVIISNNKIQSYKGFLIEENRSDEIQDLVYVDLTGAGIYCKRKVTALQTIISENVIEPLGFFNATIKGAGVYCSSGYMEFTTISSNIIHRNSGSSYGGGINCRNLDIFNSYVQNNRLTTGYGWLMGGAGIYSSNLKSVNSFITTNIATIMSIGDYKLYGGGIFTNSAVIVNSRISDNNLFSLVDPAVEVVGNGVYFDGGGGNIFNSILLNDINGDQESSVSISHSIISTTSIPMTNVSTSVTICVSMCPTITHVERQWLSPFPYFWPVTIFNLTDQLVDKGSNSLYDIPEYKNSDYRGNPRFSGSSIDIGPEEMPLTQPSLTFTSSPTSIAAEQIVTFSYEAKAAATREISYVEVNSSSCTVLSTISTECQFPSSGELELTFTVYDNYSEYSIYQLPISISEKPIQVKLEEMYGLGFSAGISSVLSTPVDYDLQVINELSKSLSEVSSTWSLIFFDRSVTDFTIFSESHLLWLFKDNNWSFFTHNEESKETLLNSGFSLLDVIPARKPIWIKK